MKPQDAECRRAPHFSLRAAQNGPSDPDIAHYENVRVA